MGTACPFYKENNQTGSFTKYLTKDFHSHPSPVGIDRLTKTDGLPPASDSGDKKRGADGTRRQSENASTARGEKNKIFTSAPRSPTQPRVRGARRSDKSIGAKPEPRKPSPAAGVSSVNLPGDARPARLTALTAGVTAL